MFERMVKGQKSRAHRMGDSAPKDGRITYQRGQNCHMYEKNVTHHERKKLGVSQHKIRNTRASLRLLAFEAKSHLFTARFFNPSN
jgi:hypothetical protein